jgi:hypothetical protein
MFPVASTIALAWIKLFQIDERIEFQAIIALDKLCLTMPGNLCF